MMNFISNGILRMLIRALVFIFMGTLLMTSSNVQAATGNDSDDNEEKVEDAEHTKKATASVAEVFTCSKKNLKLKNCYMKLGNNRVRAWQGKLFLNDMIERDFLSFEKIETDQTTAVEWEFLQAKKVNQRWFLEMGLWGPPVGEGAVESLWWLVFEIRDGKWVKHLEKLLQKRKKIGEEKYKYDSKFKYELFAKNKNVHWVVHKEKGSLK